MSVSFSILRKIAIVISAYLPLTAATYTYDTTGRLVKIDYGNGSTISYSYDKAGNVLSKTVTASSLPAIASVAVANGGTDIAQNAWIVIKGSNLVSTSTPTAGVIWSTAPSFAQGQMPTNLGGVSVAVNGHAAFVYFYCSAATSPVCASDQVNVLTPLDSTLGSVQVIVTNNGVSTAAFTANMKAIAPAFLLFNTAGYAAATHLNGSLLGPPTLYPGASTPAKPGEQIVIYGVGFGVPTTALVNGSASQTGSLASTPSCQIGGNAAAVTFAGLTSPGLYQFNVTVPPAASNGDNALSCNYAGSSTLAGALISVQQ